MMNIPLGMKLVPGNRTPHRAPGAARVRAKVPSRLAVLACLGAVSLLAASLTAAADDTAAATLSALPAALEMGGDGEVYTPVEAPRGRRPNRNFLDPSDIDSIDTDSGNLIVRIPLGQSYDVGPLLSYRIQAVHNANAWNAITVRCHQPTGGGACAVVPPADFSVPNPGSNAGLGWEVHFGKLYQPPSQMPAGLDPFQQQRWPNRDGDDNNQPDDSSRWMYVSPDGGTHHLFSLDGRINTDPVTGLPIRYSKDGSFLRLRQIDAATVHIERPDGVISVFKSTNQWAGTEFCNGSISGCWRFDRMIDPHGNTVWVSYSRDWPNQTETWTVGDSTGRQHRIHFSFSDAVTGGGDGVAPFETDQGDEWGDLPRLVTQVDLAASIGRRALYDFQYSLETVGRGCPHDAIQFPSPGFTTLRAPVLRSISVPGSQPWRFETITWAGGSCQNDTAKLSRVIAPSQGQVGYQYAEWRSPTPCVYTTLDPGQVELFTRGRGIWQRTTYRVDGSVEGTTLYTNALYPLSDEWVESGPSCSRANYRRTTVDTPRVNLRFKRTLFFHAVTEGPRNPDRNTPLSQWQVTDRGLPFTKTATRGGTSTDFTNRLFLSVRTLDCTDHVGCTGVSDEWVRYVSEFRSCSKITGDHPSCYQVNPLLEKRETVYVNDGGRSVYEENISYDGAGHFRTRKVTDGLVAGNPVWSTWTGYTVTNSTEPAVDPQTGYFLATNPAPSTYLPAPGAPWILHPYNAKVFSGGGRTYRADFEFDARGSLTCVRKRKNPNAWGSTDVLVKLTRGGQVGVNAGLVTAETFAGGDTGNLSTGTRCPSATGSVAAGNLAVVDHTYQKLQLASSILRGDSIFRYRATIDANTGLPTATFGPTGQRTDHEYDLLGRSTRDLPEASLLAARTEIQYLNPAAASPSILTRRWYGSTLMAEERTDLDGFNRPLKKTLRRPLDGAGTPGSSVQLFRYDSVGRLVTESTVQDAATATTTMATTYAGYDALDRPGSITRPDGTVETLGYAGVRRTTRTVQVGTTVSGTQPVTTSTELDAFGRTVWEDTPLYWTRYSYDPFGKRVRADRSGAGTTLTQSRVYGYDGRGFLLSEQLPELGSGGNATRFYSRDVLGNPRRAYGGGADLTHSYDRGARLTQIRETAGGRVWVENAYSDSNNGTDFRKGKLVRAVRHNYPVVSGAIGHWTVVETYEYRGTLGQLSQKTMQTHEPELGRIHETFKTQFAYDSLGHRNWLRLPFCVQTPETLETKCADGPNDVPAPDHRITTTLFEGRPLMVQSTLGPQAVFSYHPNLQTARIDYGNGTRQVIDAGVNGMRRPRRIQVKIGTTTLWDSGFYSYDGAGNITAIGSDVYTYDAASRLTYGTILSVSPSRAEAYGYDPFGNPISVSTDWGPWRGMVYSNNHLLRSNDGDPGYAGIAYDGWGNLIRAGLQNNGLPAYQMSYDVFHMQTSFRSDTIGADYAYLYGPGNYRLIIADLKTAKRIYQMRDLDGRVLREFELSGWGPYVSASSPGVAWTLLKDFIHSPSGLAATREANGTVYYFHHDHLGTSRLITNVFGSVAGRHHYYPFGAYIYQGPQVQENVSRFTGHERDRHQATDYMLGRTYLYPYWRFASPDPARDGWNLYAFARNNPIRFVDRTGLASGVFHDQVTVTAEAPPSTPAADRAQVAALKEEFGSLKRALEATDAPSREFVIGGGDPNSDASQVLGIVGENRGFVEGGEKFLTLVAAAPIAAELGLAEAGFALSTEAALAGGVAGAVSSTIVVGADGDLSGRDLAIIGISTAAGALNFNTRGLGPTAEGLLKGLLAGFAAKASENVGDD